MPDDDRPLATKDFSETVQARAARDPGFRRGLLREAIQCLLAGDVVAGRIVLRDYMSRLGVQVRIETSTPKRRQKPPAKAS